MAKTLYQSNTQTLWKFLMQTQHSFPYYYPNSFLRGSHTQLLVVFLIYYLILFTAVSWFINFWHDMLTSWGSIWGHSSPLYLLIPLQLPHPLPIQYHILVKAVVVISLLWPLKYCSILRKKEAIIIPPFLYNSLFSWH